MSKELDLKDYIRILRKRIWLITAIVLACCLITGLLNFFWIEPTYQASTKLIVNKSNESTAVGQIDINTVNLNLRLIDTYKEIIKTPAIMDKVATEHPEFGLTSEELTSRVNVSSVNNTQVMTVSVQDPSYKRAAELVNAVSKVFIQEIPQIMKVDNVSLLAPANTSKQPGPVKPRPVLNIAIAFVVSTMIAVGLSFLLEYLDDTIRTEKDVEEFLGYPTIAIIPKMKDDDFKNKQHTANVSRKEEQHVEIST